MKTLEQLKPCPFCGGEVCRDYVNDEYHRDISCTDCGQAFRMSDEQWNKRYQGANEKLMEASKEMFELLTELGEIGSVAPPWDCQSNRWRAAISQPADESRKELVEALKAAEDCLNPNTDPRDLADVLKQARAALRKAGEL